MSFTQSRYHRPLLAIVGLCLAAILAAPARMQDAADEIIPLSPPPTLESDGPVNETPRQWFVELESAPAAEGTNLATLRNEKANFRSAARRAGVAFTERYAFDTLWNGLSIEIDPANLSALSRLPGVRALYPVERISVPAPEQPAEESPELARAIAQTGVDIAQNSLGLTGAGVRVGIIDSGIDYRHADLGGGFGPGFKVAVGWDFVGDAFSTGAPVEDPDPLDCRNAAPGPNDPAGHGTHVAGIVGANGAIRGVAPGVTLGAYRVFGCTGGTSADIMIRAMERALADRMHIVNMSIGSFGQWPRYPTARASDRLVNKGVVVVASIGNSGANGLYSSSAPGVGQKVIGVASFNNTHSNSPTFTITNDNRVIAYAPGSNPSAPVIPTSGSYPMARTGTPSSIDDACNTAPPLGDLTGRVALIRRLGCSFYEKARNAQNAGAVAVVIYNNTTGGIAPSVVPPAVADPLVDIPVVGITAVDGVEINNRLASGSVTMTWTSQWSSSPLAASASGLISSFSSYGLSPDLALKPDIGAPGGTIRSTYPLERGGSANLSGTSMAAPHVAGAVALLLEAHPRIPAQAVGRILQNSAGPRLWFGNPGLGFVENVHRQGAGMLNIANAIQATTRIEPGSLSLGESEAGPATRTLTIKNEGAIDVTYDLSHTPSLATGPNTFTPAFFNAPSSVSFSAPSVLVPAGGTATVDVTIGPNAGLADRSLYGGYIVFTPQGGGQTHRVAFAGFKGDYQSIQTITPTANGFPWLARLTGTSFFKVPSASDTFNMTDAQNIPYFVIHLDHPVRLFRMEVFDAATGRAWHRAFQQEYLARNSAATSFFAFSWDGVTTSGNRTYVVPNGQYVMRITVVKALGDSANPAHVETWTSPVFTIARP